MLHWVVLVGELSGQQAAGSRRQAGGCRPPEPPALGRAGFCTMPRIASVSLKVIREQTGRVSPTELLPPSRSGRESSTRTPMCCAQMTATLKHHACPLARCIGDNPGNRHWDLGFLKCSLSRGTAEVDGNTSSAKNARAAAKDRCLQSWFDVYAAHRRGHW